ncbi:MAG: hypothetical protein Q7S53_02040 [bacterium]|nr:hypothetical protein [bacterium]
MKFLLLALPILFIVINFYCWFTLGKQKESRQTSSTEVLNAMECTVWADTTHMTIAIRELDADFLERVFPLVREKLFGGGELRTLDFIIGPCSSAEKERQDLSKIDELCKLFPQKVSVYIKRPGYVFSKADKIGEQFIMTDTRLLVKSQLVTRSILVESPNKWTRRRYESQINEVKASDKVIKKYQALMPRVA